MNQILLSYDMNLYYLVTSLLLHASVVMKKKLSLVLITSQDTSSQLRFIPTVNDLRWEGALYLIVIRGRGCNSSFNVLPCMKVASCKWQFITTVSHSIAARVSKASISTLNNTPATSVDINNSFKSLNFRQFQSEKCWPLQRLKLLTEGHRGAKKQYQTYSYCQWRPRIWEKFAR